jgi:formate dehydrogenase beta subunit
VDVFEALSEAGGMAAVGIPEYRLPKQDTLQEEISTIETLGGNIYYNQRLGEHFSLKDLQRRGYKAIFLGLGAHKGKTLNVPGEDRSMPGYISGVKFLLYINHYYIDLNLPVDLGDRMVVVGGGNVAMDCVRSALRLGVKEVHLVYRRSKQEMPADHEEIEAAEKEGVIFHYLSHPTRIIHEGNKVTGIELITMKLGEPDASGRRGVRPEEGSEHILNVDFVVPAIGQTVDHSFMDGEEIELDKWGCVKVDTTSMMTSMKGVFAGGDCVSGPATFIEAMSQGEKAAEAIDDYLTFGRVKFKPKRRMSQLIGMIDKLSKEPVHIPVKPQYRVEIPELDPKVRKRIFEEVEKPISLEEAYQEANRCMRCYRVYSVITEK